MIDAAFMQFYLSMESLLESYKENQAIKNGLEYYGEFFAVDLQIVVKHVYSARNIFFGHAQPHYLKGLLDSDTAFNIAKQTLVARWIARTLLSLELKRPLTLREMRLYPKPNYSVCFYGLPEELLNEFKLPKLRE
jgi:hypothetical protein